MSPEYGEFKCPLCSKVFHIKKQLAGHMGGEHRRGVTQKMEVITCKHCNRPLIKGHNWGLWAVKQRNLICNACKNQKNKKSQLKRIEKRREAFEALKERYRKHKEVN